MIKRRSLDIDTEKPLLVGYFLERLEGKDLWIQFKYERWGDFCYKCGILAHVTRKCSYERPATITTSVGVEARLYGPWLRSEVPVSILFVNPLKSVRDQLQISKADEVHDSRSTNHSWLNNTLFKDLTKLE